MTRPEFKVGDAYRRFGNKYHVRAIVDQDEETQNRGWYVIRWWRRSKQRWEYDCEPVWLIDHELLKSGSVEKDL